MGFLKKILSPFRSAVTPASDKIAVRCNRCGEVIMGEVNLRNDLSIEYGASEADTTYFCRKVLIGEGRCFQQIEVELVFNKDHKLIERRIQGGKFLEEA